MMDGYTGDSLIVAATNHEGLLDRAMWRRFDEVLFLHPPADAQISELLAVKLRGIRTDFETVDQSVFSRFSGLSHADIERVLIRAIKTMVLAGREFLSLDFIDEALTNENERRLVVEDEIEI